MNPKFFRNAAALRAWLEKNHARADELWVGFYKRESGRKGVDYKEAVDEALCFGWIDGVRKRVDEVSYTNRFTPRKAKSYWSAVNTKRANELIAEGRMHEAGLRAFESRDASKTQRYSFERETATLSPEYEALFQKARKAWEFWIAQPPGYRKLITHWVVSAKKEETRRARLDKLIALSKEGKRVV